MRPQDVCFRYRALRYIDIDMFAEFPQQADFVFTGNLKAALDERSCQPGTIELGDIHPLRDIGRIDFNAFLQQPGPQDSRGFGVSAHI